MNLRRTTTQKSSYADKILKLPFRGAPTTVAAIKRAALESQEHYEVRELAEEICKEVKPKDYISEPLAIFFYVCQNTRYTRDPRTIELVRAPYLIVNQIIDGRMPSLDCDDMAATICALAMAVGCRCRVATVAFDNKFYKGQRQYSHVYAEVQDPKTRKWLILDPVAGRKTMEMKGRTVAVKYWPIA